MARLGLFDDSTSCIALLRNASVTFGAHAKLLLIYIWIVNGTSVPAVKDNDTLLRIAIVTTSPAKGM